MQLKINPDLQNFIRPLTAEEFNLLEISLKNDGCREPITILEDRTIIDGHNRYAICRKHNIEYTTFVQKSLDTETDIKLWMLYNQIGKRNYANIDKALVAIEIEKLEKVKALERMHHLDEEPRSELTYPQESGKALEIAAKSVGLGYGTVYKTKHILEKAPEALIEKVKKQEVSIDRAFTQIQKAERLEKNKATEWPKGKYRVIYADPPWQYGDERAGGNHGGAVDHYNTMGINELKNMPIASLAEDNAVLFLWGTVPLLPEALELINAWDFKYKTNFVWDKVRHNMGHYNSVRHELLLIATKGSCTPDNVQLFDSVQSIERTDRHSEKPEEFRKIIDTLYTYGNKLEMFSRKSVEGWDVFGNEC